MPVVEVKNLTKRFGSNTVVDSLDIAVERGEILALLGSSGCGKTTTLRCVAGLETPTAGEIWIDGQQVVGGAHPLPPEDRNVGMVFQSYAIWPHMTVAANVAYGLKVKRVKRSEIKDKVTQALNLVMLDGLGERYPAELSGGQQQRVALARSLVTEPAVLLLDEPLSNLDAKLRERMRSDLREMVKRAGITAIHITHDQAEAMAVADRIALMNRGHIVQLGTAREIYRQPRTRFVAGFVGSATFVDAVVVRVEADRVALRTGSGLDVVARRAEGLRPGEAAVLALRPEDFMLSSAPPAPGAVNVWPAAVAHSQFLGPTVEYALAVGSERWAVSSAVDHPDASVRAVSLAPDNVIVLRPELDEPAPSIGTSDDAAATEPQAHNHTAGVAER